jgi:hypothetical protein
MNIREKLEALGFDPKADHDAAVHGALDALLAVKVSVRKLCTVENNEGYEEEDAGQEIYRCVNENGDAFIETEDLAEAVAGMVVSYDYMCEAHENAAAALQIEVTRAREIEMKYRKVLWMGHGHDHLYGDDGEMQCTQCPSLAWDYRRAPLEVLERAVWEARVKAGT